MWLKLGGTSTFRKENRLVYSSQVLPSIQWSLMDSKALWLSGTPPLRSPCYTGALLSFKLHKIKYFFFKTHLLWPLNFLPGICKKKSPKAGASSSSFGEHGVSSSTRPGNTLLISKAIKHSCTGRPQGSTNDETATSDTTKIQHMSIVKIMILYLSLEKPVPTLGLSYFLLTWAHGKISSIKSPTLLHKLPCPEALFSITAPNADKSWISGFPYLKPDTQLAYSWQIEEYLFQRAQLVCISSRLPIWYLSILVAQLAWEYLSPVLIDYIGLGRAGFSESG